MVLGKGSFTRNLCHRLQEMDYIDFYGTIYGSFTPACDCQFACDFWEIFRTESSVIER